MMNRQQATQTLREKGVVVFPGLYADRSMALAEEHHRCFSESLAGLKLAPPMDGEKILPARAIDLLNHQLTTLHQCLFPDWFRQLGELYFQCRDSRNDFASICEDTYKHDRRGAGNHHPHWDPTLSLRLMIYVSDVTTNNGAIQVKSGTHYRNHRTRLEQWKNQVSYQDPCLCSGANLPYENIEGCAGTAIVFDVSVTHRKGIVGREAQRSVAFSHIHSPLAQLQLAGTPFGSIPQSLLWPHGKPDDQ